MSESKTVCVGCGAEVAFPGQGQNETIKCPGCSASLRRHRKYTDKAIPVGMELPEHVKKADLESVSKRATNIRPVHKKPATAEEEPDVRKTIQKLAQVVAEIGKQTIQSKQAITRLVAETAPDTKRPQSTEHDESTPAEPAEKEPETKPRVRTVEEDQDAKEKDKTAPPPAHTQNKRSRTEPLWNEAGNPLTPSEARVIAKKARATLKGSPWEQEPALAPPMRKSFRVTFWFASGIAAALLLALGLSTLRWVHVAKKRTKATDIATAEKLTNAPTLLTPEGGDVIIELFPEQEPVKKARKIAKRFARAWNMERTASYIFPTQKSKELLTRYYVKRPRGHAILQKAYQVGAGKWIAEFLLEYEDSRQRHPLTVLGRDERFGVHWESLCELGTYDWEDYLSLKPTAPTKMRVWLREVPFYLHNYPEAQWQAYAIHDYFEKHLLYGYALRESATHQNLREVI